MNCIYCANALPDTGFYCPICTKQNKCKHCKEPLIPNSKVCIMCGEEVGQVSSSTTNLNTIEFSESETGRSFKATFTDTVGQSISESFGMILANKIKADKQIDRNQQPNKFQQSPVVDAEAEVIKDDVPQIPPPPSIPPVITSEVEKLKTVFKEEGEKVTLLETRLKAKSKRDYAIRLTLIFLYYKHLTGLDDVPRASITSLLNDASVEDSNFRYWLGHNNLIGINGTTVHIKAPGKEDAKTYITEVFNSDLKTGWQIGATKSSGKKKDKKSGE